MKVMKRTFITLLLIMAFIGEAMSQESQSKIISLPDTLLRTDTIVIREVITRTDVVHRTEKVVRYEEKKVGGTVEYYSGPDENTVIIENPSSLSMEKNTQLGSILGNQTGSHTIIRDTVFIAQSLDSDLFPPQEGGNYIWVPDSMESKVMSFLNNHEVRNWSDKNPYEVIDPNEKVIFRGDTIPMVLKSRNLGRFDRGLFNFLFIPKGIWQIGLTASYGEFSTEDLELLDLISDVDFSGKIFSVKPYFQYFLKNNISLGLRLGYTNGNAKIGSFKVDIDEDMNFNIHDIMYRSESYSAGVTFTQYLGIARRGRFGIFNEVELELAGGNTDFNRPFNGEMKMTHTNTFQLGLNFSPGLCVYIIDPLSFNVSFGVFGLNLKHEKQTENGVSLGRRTTSGANFRFNIFNINFGIAVNI